MRKPTRVLFCRLGIVLFCLLPTATVGGWIIQRSTGRYANVQRAEWERELTSRLGLTAKIGAVTYPSPAVARLVDVQLLDPETHSPIVRAAALDIGKLPDGYIVEASQLSMEASQLGLLSRQLDSHILRAPLVGGEEDAHFSILFVRSDITIQRAGRSQSLQCLAGTLHATKRHVEWSGDFQLPGELPSAEPLRLKVTRNRAAEPPETVWHLSTAGRGLPCELLADALPALKRLGNQCLFTGDLECRDSAVGFRSFVTGVLDGVDLDSLVTEHFPHRLSGIGLVKIERAMVENGRLLELRGTLQAQNGAVSHSLVTAAAEHLQLIPAADSRSMELGQLISYRQLSLGFHLNGRALSLTGSADPTQEGVLLANAAGPILQVPPQHAAPAVSLLRTLLPENQYQVPATRQTNALVSLLPMPDLSPAQMASRSAAHVPTRLARPSGAPAAAPIRQPVLR